MMNFLHKKEEVIKSGLTELFERGYFLSEGQEGGREKDHGQLCAPCEDNDGGMRKMMTVRLIAHTPEPEKVVAAAAKLCYSDAHITDLLDGLDEEKTARFLTMLSDLGHASPIEHASFTFGIEGVSRTLLAQITRHRIASFSVQSQRYVRLDDFRYVIPPEIEAIPEARAQFIASMTTTREVS